MMPRRTGFVAVIAAIGAALLFLTWQGLRACGPDFDPTTFVDNKKPDNTATFGRGHLGLLQAGFDSTDYAVAFRYLNGGTLSAAEQMVYAPPPTQVKDATGMTPEQAAAAQRADAEAVDNASALIVWQRERSRFLPALATKTHEQSLPTDAQGNVAFDPDYLNCPDAAFRTAALTLKARATTWGAKSPWLAAWIQSQDAVFAHCAAESSATPAPLPANPPALLRADWNYQVAASRFYARQFDAAADDFRLIAGDKNSPWSGWGQYLAARATVRKAFALGKKTDPYSNDLAAFDMDTMRHAQQILQHLLDQEMGDKNEPANPGASRSAILQELNLIRLRTEPEKRLTEICAALAGPAPDSNFSNDLADLNFVLIKQLHINQAPPLFQWIADWRQPADTHAFSEWKQNRGLPWLVLAMSKAQPGDSAAPQLLTAALSIKPESPAHDTVFFHRVRLLIGSRHSDEARSLLDEALPAIIQQPPSSLTNALLGQRMAVARSYTEFLQYAPRTSLATSSPYDRKQTWTCTGNPVWMRELGHCPTASEPPSFDADSISVLNLQAPMDLLVEAANSETLPPNLHHDVVLSAWTRSVVLEDAVNAARLAPLLPEALRKSAGSGIGFAADLAILRNPGLRPYLEAGTSRLDDFSQLDSYRDNWWNARWEGRYQSASPQLDKPDYAAFLTSEQIQRGEAEAERVMQLPAGPVVIGRRIVEYAKAHPEDPEVPSALALIVRATRYGAQNWDHNGASIDNAALSKAAFDLLHARYPNSRWAASTPYHY